MNLYATSLNSLAQAIAGQIGNCLAGGMVILLFATGFSFLLRRESAGARFMIWYAGLVTMGGLPLLAALWSARSGPTSSVWKAGTAAIILPSRWALYFFAAWCVVAAIGTVRIALGIWQVWALRRRSVIVDFKQLPPELQNTLRQFLPRRKVSVLLSDAIQSPTAIGLLGPAVVFPAWLFEELPTAELRQILLHELAHLRRWDDWSNLLQKIVKALFFFHPAVWWMERQVSFEREMACDEAVLEQTGNPRAYAKCLVGLAERSLFRRSAILAQAAVSRVGQTSRRVARILGGNPRSTGMGRLAVPSFAVALLACLVSVTKAPKLIAFRSGAETQSMQAAAVAPLPQVSPMMVQSVSANPERTNVSTGVVRAAVGSRKTVAKAPASPGRLQDLAVEAKLNRDRNPAGGALQEQLSSSEVLVVLVESSSNDGYATQSVWQVQMWQITVLRSTVNPAPQAAPPKEI